MRHMTLDRNTFLSVNGAIQFAILIISGLVSVNSLGTIPFESFIFFLELYLALPFVIVLGILVGLKYLKTII